jgi:hypothetical protein
MKGWPTRPLAVAFLAFFGGCAPAVPLTMPAGPLPDLRGAWTGTWGGTPLTLVILEQQEAMPVEGVFLGTWHVLGRKMPGVSGVLTFIIRGEPVSVNVQGRLADSSGRTTLILEPVTVNGGRMTLTHRGEHRLVGEGTSRMWWEPEGPVELAR